MGFRGLAHSGGGSGYWNLLTNLVISVGDYILAVNNRERLSDLRIVTGGLARCLVRFGTTSGLDLIAP